MYSMVDYKGNEIVSEFSRWNFSNDGGFIVNHNSQFYKYDAKGNRVWNLEPTYPYDIRWLDPYGNLISTYEMNNDLYIIKIDSFGKETIVYLEQEREFNGWIRIKFYEDFIYFYYQINEQDITLKIFDLNWNIQKELLIEGLRDIRYSKDNEFVYEIQDENKDYYLVKMNVNGEQLFKLGPYERMYSITILDSGFQYEYSKNGFYFATQIDRNGQEVSKLGPYESYEDLKARDYIENVCDGNCTHQVLMKTRDNELIISKMENNKSYLMKIDHRGKRLWQIKSIEYTNIVMNYSLGQSSDNYAGSEDALGNIYLVYSIDDSIKLVKYNQNGKILFEIPLDRYTLGLKVMDNGEIVTTYKTLTGLKLSIINQKGKTINNKDIIGVQETKNQTNIYTKKDKTIEKVIIPGKFRII